MNVSVRSNDRVSVVSRFLGPTDCRGARVRVRRGDHRQGDKVLVVGWDYSLGVAENHAEAIRRYLVSLDNDSWSGDWVVSCAGDGYVGVMV